MPTQTRLQDREAKELRTFRKILEGTLQTRFYTVHPRDVLNSDGDSSLPDLGDPFPGGVVAAAGPFIINDGEQWQQQLSQGGNPQNMLVLTALTLNGTVSSGTYIELPGRRIQKNGGNIVYITQGVALTVDDGPKRGEILADPNIPHAAGAVCVPISIDLGRYPGRVFCQSVWDAPVRFQEIGVF